MSRRNKPGHRCPGVRSQESGSNNQEPQTRSKEKRIRTTGHESKAEILVIVAKSLDKEPRTRKQEPGAKSQEPKARSLKPGGRSQEQ